MLDLMYKAADKAAWDAFVEALPGGVKSAVLIDEIGPITTASVVDEHWFVNLRAMNNEDATALAVGGPGVEWIDPDLVSSPSRIWAGGMNYFRK